MPTPAASAPRQASTAAPGHWCEPATTPRSARESLGAPLGVGQEGGEVPGLQPAQGRVRQGSLDPDRDHLHAAGEVRPRGRPTVQALATPKVTVS